MFDDEVVEVVETEFDLDLLYQAESPALKRLIDEVRNDQETGEIVNYNRFHNRHNRSGFRIKSPAQVHAWNQFEEKPNSEKICKICGKPLEDDATDDERIFFYRFDKHKQCVHQDYVRGSDED
jgi:ribosomal protein L34E